MYTEQDKKMIVGRIRKYCIMTVILLALLIAVDVVGLIKRWEILVMVVGGLLFVAGGFMWIMYLWPNIRYYTFLRDMKNGLSREVEGNIVEISAQEDYQDGVRVLPVRIFNEEDQDERIVYLNVSKADQFPKAGENVRLNCFGRHILEVTVL